MPTLLQRIEEARAKAYAVGRTVAGTLEMVTEAGGRLVALDEVLALLRAPPEGLTDAGAFAEHFLEDVEVEDIMGDTGGVFERCVSARDAEHAAHTAALEARIEDQARDLAKTQEELDEARRELREYRDIDRERKSAC